MGKGFGEQGVEEVSQLQEGLKGSFRFRYVSHRNWGIKERGGFEINARILNMSKYTKIIPKWN